MKKHKKHEQILGLVAGFFIVSVPASPAHAGLQLVVAPDAIASECDFSGQTLSKEVSSSDLIKHCHDVALSLSNGPANRWSADGTVHVFGYHALLFIDVLDVAHPNPDGSIPLNQSVVSGSNVIFKSIQAIAIDDVNGELFVLDASTKSISVYPTNENGDIYPRRKLVSPALEDASAIAVDSVNGEVIVLNSKTNSLFVFGRMASSDGLKPEHATGVRRKIDLSGLLLSASSLTDVAVSPNHSELFILDLGSSRIAAFDRVSERPSLKQSYDLSGVAEGTQYIQYSLKDDSIRAMKSDGTGHEFSIGPSGPSQAGQGQ